MHLTRRNIVGAIAFLTMAAARRGSIAADVSAEQKIIHLLKSTFERTGAPLTVEPVVVTGDHAIAGWIQDGRGGRALMRRVKGEWTVHLCSGDSLRDASVLTSTGIPDAQAKGLAEALAKAEAKLSPAALALLGTFEGTVMIGPDGHHPPAPGHHKH